MQTCDNTSPIFDCRDVDQFRDAHLSRSPFQQNQQRQVSRFSELESVGESADNPCGLLQGWDGTTTQLGKDSTAIISGSVTSSSATSTATSTVTTAAGLRGSLEDRLEREYLLSSRAASSSTSTPDPPYSSFTQAPISTYSTLSSTSFALTDSLSNKFLPTTVTTTPTSTSTYLSNAAITTTSSTVTVPLYKPTLWKPSVSPPPIITTTSSTVTDPLYKPTLWKSSISPPPTPPSPTKTPRYTFSGSSGSTTTTKSSSIFENDNDLSKFEDPVKYNSWRASRLIEETQHLLESQQKERAQAAKVVVSTSPVSYTTSTYSTISSASTKKDYTTVSNLSVTSVKATDCSKVKVEEPVTVQSPPNSSLPTTAPPILDHSPGEVYTIPEEEEEMSSPIGSDGVTSLRRRGGQCLNPPKTN